MGQGSSMTYQENFQMPERHSYGPSNYKGKKSNAKNSMEEIPEKEKR